MREHTIKLYSFDELTDEAKDRAIQDNCYINTDHDWYNFIYDEAERLGFKITEFDLDRHCQINGEMVLGEEEIAGNIIKEHGESTNTYKTAKEFLDKRTALFNGDDTIDEDDERCFELDEMDSDFFRMILDCYFDILRDSYKYYISEEAIKETLQVNEYEFTEDGKIYY